VTRNLEPNDVRVGGHHERTIPGPSMDTKLKTENKLKAILMGVLK
jgi:hypothetical protein